MDKKSLATIPEDSDILTREKARALEREIDSVKRELKDFTDKTITRLDGLRKKLLDIAA